MTITTDYTREGNPNTFNAGAFQPYRVVHWLKDILRNFFSSSINLKDERLCGLLNMQDGKLPTELDAMFRIGVPFNPKTIIKAGTTPAVIVSAGETSYPAHTFNVTAPVNREMGTLSKYGRALHESLKLQISIVTETYDGTLLLTNLLEAFLVTHALELKQDCALVGQFTILGSTGPQEIAMEQVGAAKQVFQAGINILVTGGLDWTAYTQYPPFRGLDLDIQVK